MSTTSLPTEPVAVAPSITDRVTGEDILAVLDELEIPLGAYDRETAEWLTIMHPERVATFVSWLIRTRPISRQPEAA